VAAAKFATGREMSNETLDNTWAGTGSQTVAACESGSPQFD
jgi:hypothetical protein